MPQQPTDRKPKDDTLPPGLTYGGTYGRTPGMPTDGTPGKSYGATTDAVLGAANKQAGEDVLNLKKQWEGMSRQQRIEFAKTIPDADLNAILQTQDTGMSALGRGPVTVSASPKFGEPGWFDLQKRKLIQKGLDALPAVGGMLGEYGGGAAGVATGEALTANPAGAVYGGNVGRVVGGGIGGGVMEATRQGIEHLMGGDKYDNYTAAQRWKDIGLESFYNSLATLTGMGLNRVMGSGSERGIARTLENAENKLVYAGGFSHGANPMEASNLSVILPDLIALEKKMPVKDNKSLGELIIQLKKNIGREVDGVYGKVVTQNGKKMMFGQATGDVQPLVRAVDKAIMKYSINADLHGPELTMLRDLRTKALKPRTYGDLADWRVEINDDISAFYSKLAPEQRLAINLDPKLKALKGVADAIRDSVYPEMDRVAGLPRGSTAVLQEKRGILMRMEKEMLEHRLKLLDATKTVAGESPMSRGRLSMYMTGKGTPGGAVHRAGAIIKAPNVLRAADKRAKSAFGRTWPQQLARFSRHPVTQRAATGAAVYGYTPETRVPPPEQAGPQPAAAPTPAASPVIQQMPPKKTYKKWRQSTSTGHYFGSDDEAVWFDYETGQQVNPETGEPLK